MFLLLAVICFGLLFVLFSYQYQKLNEGPFTQLRLSFSASLLFLSVAVFVYTELASPVDFITPVTARFFWFFLCLGLAYAVYTRRNSLYQVVINDCRTIKYGLRLQFLSGPQRLLTYAALLLILGPILYETLFIAPNNLDSHNYHLHRVLIWTQNHSVGHFPTMHVQQLYHNVYAEYVLLTISLLTGSDQFVNVSQFVYMLGSLSAISYIAKMLGLTARGQFLAIILLFTLPIGLFESTTTQNDYVATFYCVTFFMYSYRFIDKKYTHDLVLALVALAFGGFTKYTILIYSLPMVVYLAVFIVRHFSIRYTFLVALNSILLFVVVFTPFLGRNYALFKGVLGPAPSSRLYSESIPTTQFSPASTLSNTLKNIGLHASLPYAPYNTAVDSLQLAAHRQLGISINNTNLSMNDYVTRFSLQEDMAPNTIHFFLIVFTAIILLSRKGNKRAKLLLVFSGIGFILFCTIFKFQFYSSRTHMPFFALTCPIIALVFARYFPRLITGLIVVLGLSSLSIVYGNPSKMLIPVRYIAKYATNYVPRDICPANLQNPAGYRTALGSYYDFTDSSSCAPLFHPLSYQERGRVFSVLDSLNYFEDERSNFVLQRSRQQVYFNDPAMYRSFAPLMTRIPAEATNIGVLFTHEVGFYYFWSALAYDRSEPLAMNYIRYKKEYNPLVKNSPPFTYTYVLSDDIHLIHESIPDSKIDSIYASQPYYLVKLKKPSSTLYPY